MSFDSADDLATDIAGADTNGNYSKINLNLANTTALTRDLTLDLSLKMQYALNNKNLDGSEDFSIGGSSGVKLYPDGESSAENGYLFSMELKYNLPVIQLYNHKLGVFYDRGRVYMSDNSQVSFTSKTLQDIGIGYYVYYKDMFGQIQVAWKIDGNDITTEPDNDSRILVQFGMTF